MFSKQEWRNFFKKIGTGILAAVAICVFLAIYSVGADLWNCFFGSNCLPEVSGYIPYLFVIIVTMIVSIIIGFASSTKLRSVRIEAEDFARAKREEAEKIARHKANQSTIRQQSDEVLAASNAAVRQITAYVRSAQGKQEEVDKATQEAVGLIESCEKQASSLASLLDQYKN